MFFNSQTKNGFTLIELLVVVAIIGILVTVATVLLTNVRANARDGKRIADIKQIRGALELYLNDEGSYPASLTAGSPLVGPTSGLTYMSKVPNNPLPDDGTGCTVAEYTYTQTNGGISYRIQFCLGDEVSGAGPNNVEAVPNEYVDIPQVSQTCGNNTLEGTEVCDHTGVSPQCELLPGYYPLNAGVPACDGRQACKSDCTECPVGECNGAQ